jgi:hypothetical protein
MVKAKKGKRAVQKEPTSAFFARTRPRFLDWMPPTPDELLLEVQKRSEERDAQLRTVTELAKAKEAKKRSERKKPAGR